jgi:hypothetical protein
MAWRDVATFRTSVVRSLSRTQARRLAATPVSTARPTSVSPQAVESRAARLCVTLTRLRIPHIGAPSGDELRARFQNAPMPRKRAETCTVHLV